MEVNEIMQIISNVGFPIACCIYLFYSNDKLRKTIEENTKAIDSMQAMFTFYINADKRGDF